MISEDFESRLQQAMQRDRFRLRRRWNELGRQGDSAAAAKRQQVEQALQESCKLRQSRQEQVPAKVQLDTELPIFDHAEEITSAIQRHQVTVVSGETGSGKSTQLPLMCLQAGYGVSGFIGHTQPRRIAARGVAARIASQLNGKLGEQVGYKIRFNDQSSDRTLIKLMTDGILLAETQTDRFLDAYDLLIIDEAHERSLNIDFLLGFIKRVLPKRPDLRLVITSATIDTERFAEHFADAGQLDVPIIHAAGRTYPVEIRYRSPEITPAEVAAGVQPPTLEQQVLSTVLELAEIDRGDMLVFLPTEYDIRSVAQKLRGCQFPGDGSAKTEILPLYARLPAEQQNQIFHPGPRRRIVLATNVAESSITVPGIRFVVDTGTARISRYAPRSKVQRLPIEAISQASANQRAGRCGRVGPGICVRLYTEQDFLQRPEFTTPEIRRTNLASVILQTQALKLGSIESFPFIDPPRPEAIRDGFKTLLEIGAVDEARRLTKLGRRLSRLPVDPRIGRMLFAASDNNCLAEVLVIAAAMEVQDPRMRPPERKGTADELHARFRHPKSDFLCWLKLWEFFHELRDKLSRSKFRKACAENFLSYMQIQQWSDVHRQLREMSKEAGLRYRTVGQADDDQAYQLIHTSLATGLLSGVAHAADKYEYTGAGGVKFHLWPGSGLFAGKPRWIMAAEIVETSKRYGRTVAHVQPEWLEPLASHLSKTRYVDPHWSRRQETAMAYENVSLFGLPIVQRRRINFSKIDPELSRKLFIEQGLAAGEVRQRFEFLEHNQRVIEQAQESVAKARRRELIVDEAAIEAFYRERLPDQAVDVRSLRQLLKSDSSLAKRLQMQLSDLLPEQTTAPGEFPTEVLVGDLKLPVKYRFAPGEPDDGATIELPLEAAAQLDRGQLGWLIPGLIKDRVEAMIRSLPKAVRRDLIPAPETAERVAADLELGRGSFSSAVAQKLAQFAGQPVHPDMFQEEKVPQNLKPNMRLHGDDNEVLVQSREISEVIRHLPDDKKGGQVVETEHEEWQQDGLTDWTWGKLPKSILVQRGVAEVPLYPALIDQQQAVGLRLFDQGARARSESRLGLTRLLQLAHRKHIRSQVKWLPDLDKLWLLASPLFPKQELLHGQLGDLLVRIAFVEFEKLPRDRESYDRLQLNANEKIGVATQDVANWLPRMLKQYHELRLVLEQQQSNSQVVGDVRQQMKRLFIDQFLTRQPWHWLKQYPRFLEAIVLRFDKLKGGNANRDREQMAELAPLQERYRDLEHEMQELGRVSEELQQAGWMLEEFRVSLFAQQLGTSEKVSRQRIEKQLAKVRSH